MKYLKLFMLFAVAAVFAACSDDDPVWNTSDSTIAMSKEDITVKESKGLFNIPVTVTGERNANIQFTVEVKECGTNPAKEDVHYLVTTKTINVSPDQDVANVQIMTVDDEDVNDPRTFTVTLVSSQGTTITDKSTTTVTIKDNDAEFYDKLGGKWVMTCVNSQGTSYKWDVTVYTAEEDEPEYNNTLYVTGMMGYAWTVAVLDYQYDNVSNKVYLRFHLGDDLAFAEQVDFGLGGVNNVYLYSVVNGSITADADIMATLDPSNMKEAVFTNANGAGIYALIFEQDGSFTGYRWFDAFDIKMSR